jgi:hypothetical protein
MDDINLKQTERPPRSKRTTRPLPGDGANIEFEDGGPALQCPACHAATIHHERTTVFGRACEDAPTRAIVIEPGAEIAHTIESDRAERTNPSSRRDAVAVQFSCEHCPAISELIIEQHKGYTYLRWRAGGQRVSIPWQDHEWYA